MNDPTSRLSTALADRYTIERELGSGGMATVYLDHDLKQDARRGSHGGQTATED
jgi:serine/threonine-protein kinase